MCVAYTYILMLTYCEVPVSAEQYFSVISCLDSAIGGAHMISCKKSLGPLHLIDHFGPSNIFKNKSNFIVQVSSVDFNIVRRISLKLW